MKEYKVVLSFNIQIEDVGKAKKAAELKAQRAEAVEIHRKRLAGIEAARKKKGDSQWKSQQ